MCGMINTNTQKTQSLGVIPGCVYFMGKPGFLDVYLRIYYNKYIRKTPEPCDIVLSMKVVNNRYLLKQK